MCDNKQVLSTEFAYVHCFGNFVDRFFHRHLFNIYSYSCVSLILGIDFVVTFTFEVANSLFGLSLSHSAKEGFNGRAMWS